MIRPSVSENRNISTVTVLVAAYSDLRYMSDRGRINFRRFYELAGQERPNPAELILEPMLEQYGVKMVAARLV